MPVLMMSPMVRTRTTSSFTSSFGFGGNRSVMGSHWPLRRKHFRVWHMLALAYAYFKTNKMTEYKKALNRAKKNYEYEDLDMEFFYHLYPEIAADMRST